MPSTFFFWREVRYISCCLLSSTLYLSIYTLPWQCATPMIYPLRHLPRTSLSLYILLFVCHATALPPPLRWDCTLVAPPHGDAASCLLFPRATDSLSFSPVEASSSPTTSLTCSMEQLSSRSGSIRTCAKSNDSSLSSSLFSSAQPPIETYIYIYICVSAPTSLHPPSI